LYRKKTQILRPRKKTSQYSRITIKNEIKLDLCYNLHNKKGRKNLRVCGTFYVLAEILLLHGQTEEKHEIAGYKGLEVFKG